MVSQRQLEANRRNARLSHGPKTPEGRAAVRLNALRHGLTAQDAVTSIDDRNHFNELLAAYQDQFQPSTPAGQDLLHQLVQASWRLRRIRAMETGLFELRWSKLEQGMKKEYGDLARHERHAYVFYRDVCGPNAFAALARYEARAERAFYRALHELQKMQPERPVADPPVTHTDPALENCQTIPFPNPDTSSPGGPDTPPSEPVDGPGRPETPSDAGSNSPAGFAPNPRATSHGLRANLDAEVAEVPCSGPLNSGPSG